jgi:hypothetical protein
MSFRRVFFALFIALTMLGPVSLPMISPPTISAAQDEETPTVEELLEELGSLRETLGKTRKDRDKYKARLEKANDKIADLEATIAALKETQPEPTAKPTKQPTPKPTKEPDRGATSAERTYWRTVKDVTLQLAAPIQEVSDIANDPDFLNDASLWFDLEDAMQPFHQIWSEWQETTYPTERLATFHTAMTDALYNYDQAATAFEIGLANVDVDWISASGDYMSAGTEALNRATDAIDAWERETGTQVDDL